MFSGKWVIVVKFLHIGTIGFAMLAHAVELPPNSDEGLARRHCGTCHLFPEPRSLDKATWTKRVLPAMLGKLSHVPPAALTRINAFYEAKAPEKPLPQARSTQPGKDSGLFTPRQPRTEQSYSLTTFVKIDSRRRSIFLGQGAGNSLGVFGPDLKRKSQITFDQGAPAAQGRGDGMIWATPSPSWVEQEGSVLYVTNMGSILPTNNKNGFLQQLRMEPSDQLQKDTVLLASLGRPTMVHRVDLDGDGTKDFLVNEFGHERGSLFWFREAEPSQRRALRSEPGALSSIVVDFNQDGNQDIVTLFTQAKEGVYLFQNMGEGSFSERALLEFSPVNGSSSIDLQDINNDGHLDIIYTCGDNADSSPVLKNFHGVYIYLNDGKNRFTRPVWFYPVHGCYKALVRDFDMDGDLDIVTISFFADYEKQPEESLLLFTQKGKMQFQPSVIDAYNRGRWLTADAGDIDGDGDEDVVLGNFSRGPSKVSKEREAHWNSQPAFTLLKNNTR